MPKLTFSSARVILKPYFPILHNAGTLGDYVNRASERLMLGSNAKDSLERVAITAYSEAITLPRQYASCEGALLSNVPVTIRNHWVEFVLAGPGMEISDDFSASQVIDMGDGYVVFKEPYQVHEDGCLLRFETDAGPAAEATNVTITVMGTDVDGKDIRTNLTTLPRYGEQLTLTAALGTVTSTETFFTVKQLVKTTMKGLLSIYAIDPDTAAETLIGQIHPADTSPSFRRYKVPASGGTDPYVVTCLCRKQYLPATHENDVLPIQIVDALIDEIQSLLYKKENDDERANRLHESALKLITDQQAKFRPAAQYPPMSNYVEEGSAHLGAFY